MAFQTFPYFGLHLAQDNRFHRIQLLLSVLYTISLLTGKRTHLCGNLYQLLTWENNIWKVFNMFLAYFNVNLAAGNKESQCKANSSSLWTPLGATAQNFPIKSVLFSIFFVFSFDVL